MKTDKDVEKMGGISPGLTLILSMVVGWLMLVALVSFTIHFFIPVTGGGIITVVVGIVSAAFIILYVRKRKKEERLEEENRAADLILDRGLTTFESEGHSEADELAKLYKDK